MLDLKFDEWFKGQYGRMPDQKKLSEVREEHWTLSNKIEKVEKLKEELEFIQRAYTNALYGWQAREKCST